MSIGSIFMACMGVVLGQYKQILEDGFDIKMNLHTKMLKNKFMHLKMLLFF